MKYNHDNDHVNSSSLVDRPLALGCSSSVFKEFYFSCLLTSLQIGGELRIRRDKRDTGDSKIFFLISRGKHML